MTLSEFLTTQAQQHQLPEQLTDVISHIAQACIRIQKQVHLGALSGILGSAGSDNVQGEEQKKLDVEANRILIETLTQHPAVAGLASEEETNFIPTQTTTGDYLILFDPLDGSSNIDVNISIGTIFSILPKPSGSLTTGSFLQKGRNQLAAGYVLYGPQTILVLTLKHGVSQFTLDNNDEFINTHTQCSIPEQTQEFAVNMSNQRHWDQIVQQYINELLAGNEGVRGKNYNMRWIASMVAEVHRILTRGGIFMYPQDKRDPTKPGKLRLMYEANPMALIVEQANGGCTNGYTNMLDIQPEKLHQRIPVFLGSREEIEYIRHQQHK